MSEADPITDEQLAALRAELFAGRKIQAIKLYRNATGSGLKESKDVIEALEDKLRETEPNQFTAARKTGCAGVILLLAAGSAIAVAWLKFA